MEFLYPTSRQYPFDAVCGEIVRELEARNFDAPGMRVEFHTYGSGEQHMRNVSVVEGVDFRLRFCRKQRTLPGGHWNDVAAVNDIAIPRKMISVYADESGPTFNVYVGNDWEADRAKFMRGHGVNSKLNDAPRTYLRYSGRCRCGERSYGSGHSHPGRRPPLLVHNNDLGREYDLNRGDREAYDTAEVMLGFYAYLRDVVLAEIMRQPIPAEQIDPCTSAEPIDWPESFGAIYCFAEHRDVTRVQQGQADANELPLAERYGMRGSGYRLLTLDIRNDGTVPEVAREGFLWCGVGDPQPLIVVDAMTDEVLSNGRRVPSKTAEPKLTIPGHHRWTDRERFVLRIRPKTANEIYIADHAAYEARRKELHALAASRAEVMHPTRFTDAEVADFCCARARTIVPIHEYAGGFKQPIVLVRRELGFDEIEVVA
jgi:hypothetical protein